MLDIREEIKIALLRKGLSMRKVSAILREKGYKFPQSSGLSTQLIKKRIRFNDVQILLDYLGYELVIREKKD